MTLARVRGLKVCWDWHVVRIDAWVWKEPSRNPGCQWRGSLIDPLLLKYPNQITVFLYFLGKNSSQWLGWWLHSQGAKVLNFWLIYRAKSCRYLHVSYLCISYLASLGHMSKLFYSCFQCYAIAPPTYSQTSINHIFTSEMRIYTVTWYRDFETA